MCPTILSTDKMKNTYCGKDKVPVTPQSLWETFCDKGLIYAGIHK